MLLAAAAAASALLAGCTAVIDQTTFFPQSVAAPDATLAAPAGYRITDAMLDLPGLGQVHSVRLDNPASETVIVYSGGNGNFVSAQTELAAALAGATGADLILYDYPGRGGTNIPATIDASIATGPLLLRALRQRGWIGRGPLFAYGLSFGGSQAAAMVREGGFAGLILEGTAADIPAVGRNFIPAIAKPFVRLRVDPALGRFDFLGYAASARAPILLLSSRDDRVVRPRNMRDFAEQLRARGAEVTLVTVPGDHGSATEQPAAMAAVRSFVETHGSRPEAGSSGAHGAASDR
jgi:pimeloyl-ACP methyl ester carboxylesterase